jgi:hypothetical protein
MIPKSGKRLSDNIVLKTKGLDGDPIPSSWITV